MPSGLPPLPARRAWGLRYVGSFFLSLGYLAWIAETEGPDDVRAVHLRALLARANSL